MYFAQGTNHYINNNFVDSMQCFIRCVENGNMNGWKGIACCYVKVFDEEPDIASKKALNYFKLSNVRKNAINTHIRLEEIKRKFNMKYH